MSVSHTTLAARAEQANVRFGTSGVRGLVADLTPEICRAYAQSFLKLAPRGPVLIGHDLRPSSPPIAGAVAQEALLMGFTPVNAGVLPTPALAYAAELRGLPAVMVTGSHIPFDRNGIKFYLPQGEITKDDEARMLAADIALLASGSAALPAPDPGVLALYVSRYTEAFAPGCLAGLRIGIYEHSSAARDVLHAVLGALGAETLGLGRSDSFVPIDTEAVRAKDRALGRSWAAAHALHAIVTTDGDADRPLLADERGEWLRGDVLGILCARELEAATVVTPVSSNTALEACGRFSTIVRTRIGSPYVIAGMEQAGKHPVVGYEANGGFLLGSAVTLGGGALRALRTRDALLPMLVVLAAARRSGLGLSAFAASLPRRFTFSDRLQNVPATASRRLIAEMEKNPAMLAALSAMDPGPAIRIDLTDGLRVTFASGDILHLRSSGNAPELRCYAEAGDAARAEVLCAAVLTGVQPLL